MWQKEVLLMAQGLRREYLRAGKGTNIFTAVKDCDLTLYAGEVLVLKGRSGSGKTTLLNMMAGLLRPTRGKVFFYPPEASAARRTSTAGASPQNADGEDSMRNADPSVVGIGRAAADLYALEDEALSFLRNRYFGYIPQGAGAVGSFSVMENVLLPYTLYGESVLSPDGMCLQADLSAAGAQIHTEVTPLHRAQLLLERLEITHLQNEMPAALSGGELRRVSIARALLRAPALVFADEPTGDLDDESTNRVFSLLRETADAGAAVLIVTHENEADAFADRVLTMNGGAIDDGCGNMIQYEP
ncbi:MAG: ATP-binding cassette domain-containing protein [Lachnospiraceae bacterium]|nr:ATP-binding cassette domain-containing protein [Lachnospiraceae bacterium]